MAGGLQPDDPRRIGPYRLVGQLGCGGMGRVFLGLSAGGRPVAVKVIRAELAADQEFRVRFGREVAAARRVSGLFTALVVDADIDGPVPWLATAYVAGPSLSQAVTEHGPMSAQPTLALAAGLAESLSAIHAAGVVHCDLKPANVLLSQDGPRVIDFGISRAAEAVSVTGVGPVVGSPGFMSPEQAMGEEMGPPSDIFSLGAVLTFAATGGGPFGQGSGPELAYRLVYQPPNLGPVPAELRPLIECCLAKDPGQRPTADEVLASVALPSSGWLPQAAVALAPGPPSPARPSRPAGPRRRWRPLAAVGVAAGVLAASAAVSMAVSGAPRHLSAAQREPGTAATAASPASPSSLAPAAPATHQAPSPSGPGPQPAIIPAVDRVPSSATATARPSASRSPRPPEPSRSPGHSPSPTSTPPLPRITSTGTYRQGVWVYFDIQYADPGKNALGFGFMGVNGIRWVEESYPFSSPHRGIVGPDSIAYPLDLECGTAKQHNAEIEAWIYDTAGASSRPVMIHLACRA